MAALKAKDIDVVVSNATVGPCVAVSIKGTLNAFRNLTNRMEEAVGDCTNLHIAYPNLVYGFLHVIRANRAGPRPDDAAHFLRSDPDGNVQANDVALRDGQPVDSLTRYHDVMAQLTGRHGVRNDVTRYESVALALVDPSAGDGAEVLREWPSADSPLRLEGFFDMLYREYDLRYVFAAPEDGEYDDSCRVARGLSGVAGTTCRAVLTSPRTLVRIQSSTVTANWPCHREVLLATLHEPTDTLRQAMAFHATRITRSL